MKTLLDAGGPFTLKWSYFPMIRGKKETKKRKEAITLKKKTFTGGLKSFWGTVLR